MYDPVTGSFLTPDPAGSYPDYTFASGNPVMLSDPTGLNPIGDFFRWVCGGSCADFARNLLPDQWRQDFNASSHSDKVAGVIAGAVVAGTIFCLFGGCEALAEWAIAAGSASAELSQDAERMVDRGPGAIVIGKLPMYLRVADELGASRFYVSQEAWSAMTSAEQWAANRAFLDAALQAGSRIVLATPPEFASGTYLRELEYLLSRGATYTPGDFMQMMPGG
jgi:hypothetical protein